MNNPQPTIAARSSQLLRRLGAIQDRKRADFKTAVVELLASLDMTADGLSTDKSHWERQERAEEAVRKALKNV